MKKIKKDEKSWGWKFAIVAIAICGSAVLICFGAKVWERLDRLEESGAATGWALTMMGWNKEVAVSDDGRWYQIPEVRVRFPFFPTLDNADLSFVGVPLRYGANFDLSYAGSKADGWLVSLTYDMVDNTWDENISEEYLCMAPFVLEHNYIYDEREGVGNFQMKEYKVVDRIRLADGQEVILRERTEGKKCLEFIGSARGEFIKSQFSKLESY